MTSRHTITTTEFGEEKTIVDLRSLEPGTRRSFERQTPFRSPGGEAKFRRPPRISLPRFPDLPRGTALGFASLGVALTCLSIFAVSEHRAANMLREAFQVESRRIQLQDRSGTAASVDSDDLPPVDRVAAARLAVGDRARSEKQATDYLVANNSEAALAQFEALRTAFPTDEVYSDFVVVLRWRTRCGQRGSAGGARCD